MEKPILPHSLIAASDLSAKQWFAVKIDTNGKIALAGAGDAAIGILQEKTASGIAGPFLILGLSNAAYGGTVTAGDELSVDANGKLIKKTGNTPTVARAVESGVAGETRTVILGGAKGADVGQKVMSFVYDLADIANGDILVNFLPGFAGKITSTSAVAVKVATTGGKLATLDFKVGGTVLTGNGGRVALTSANMTPIGAVVAGAAVADDATALFAAASQLKITASAVTAFVEGRVQVNIHCN